jgi:hypothetical protein
MAAPATAQLQPPPADTTIKALHPQLDTLLQRLDAALGTDGRLL